MPKNIKDVINSIPKNSPKGSDIDFLSDDNYAKSCQEVMNEALKNGYDVLHMENGDIITTGTKVVVTQYRWDPAKKKMLKVMSKQKD
jgi:predicted house-cleaning noncanonical NTP pyrophosphatase (MazG superfamily)